MKTGYKACIALLVCFPVIWQSQFNGLLSGITFPHLTRFFNEDFTATSNEILEGTLGKLFEEASNPIQTV
ncbi:MAG: hypothetical protein HQM08_06185 [Candidatus Riflebacteria bacterium]|nr:hypothetical protein [Candidatus Riflebacteria bacterium]